MIRRLFQKSTDPDIWISDPDPAPEKYVLVTVSGKDGEKTVLDNNPAPDTQKPKLDDITGVIFFTIPLIGKLLTPKGLMILVPCLFGLWLIIDSIKNED